MPPIQRSVRQPVQARSLEKKERIVNAARDLINRMGLEAVTTNRIARAAGVSVGTVYSYFEDKHHIFDAVSEQYHTDMFVWAVGQVEELSRQASCLQEAISGLVRIVQQIHAKEPGIHKEAVIQSLKEHKPESHAPELDKSFDRAAYDLLMKFGHEMEQPDPEAGYYLIGITVEEAIHHMLIYGSPVSEERVFTQLSRMLYRYLAKDP